MNNRFVHIIGHMVQKSTDGITLPGCTFSPVLLNRVYLNVSPQTISWFSFEQVYGDEAVVFNTYIREKHNAPQCVSDDLEYFRGLAIGDG